MKNEHEGLAIPCKTQDEILASQGRGDQGTCSCDGPCLSPGGVVRPETGSILKPAKAWAWPGG